MYQDQQMPITLTVINRRIDLPVISISGREALNTPYCFTIDILSADPNLPTDELERRTAYLTLDQDHGVHGRISSVSRLYAGASLNLYRLTLGPALADLQQRARRRVFRGLNVRQIITRLLDEHGIAESDYRFDTMMGVYPPRETCVQHDETDLHLLQRLCEEEGIHFRFEQHETHHLLVFADDPACFPYHPTATGFQPPALRARHIPAISYLAERYALHPPTIRHSAHQGEWNTSTAVTPDPISANHRFEASASSRMPTEQQAHNRQISARTLERQRCERRGIFGLSAELPLTPGHIMQVQNHPDARFNDQWLLIEVIHAGKQPQALRRIPREEVAAILEAIKTFDAPCASLPTPCQIPAFDRGYHNSFQVLPWEMPFRAPLKHAKPALSGFHNATLVSGSAQTMEQFVLGRLPIRVDQQRETDDTLPELNAPLCLSLPQVTALRSGTTLTVGHFDNDPDRPVVYDLPAPRDAEAETVGQPLQLNANDLLAAETVTVGPMQTLHLSSSQSLKLQTGERHFELTEQRIRLTGTPSALAARNLPKRPRTLLPSVPLFFDTDLRLTEQPELKGAPLPNQLWYIVRMREPSLEYLARLHPEDFLFEGKTDQQGYFGLGPQRLRELAALYRDMPDNLCLVHPGHCIRLQAWFQQNWPPKLHQAFMQYS